MSRINREDVREFVWSVCEQLAELDVTESEPGSDYNKDELQDRYSVAFLTNSSLFDLLYNECSIQETVDFIESTIEGFGHIPCGSVLYIEALLKNPSLFKMITEGLGKVVKG